MRACRRSALASTCCDNNDARSLAAAISRCLCLLLVARRLLACLPRSLSSPPRSPLYWPTAHRRPRALSSTTTCRRTRCYNIRPCATYSCLMLGHYLSLYSLQPHIPFCISALPSPLPVTYQCRATLLPGTLAANISYTRCFASHRGCSGWLPHHIYAACTHFSRNLPCLSPACTRSGA